MAGGVGNNDFALQQKLCAAFVMFAVPAWLVSDVVAVLIGPYIRCRDC